MLSLFKKLLGDKNDTDETGLDQTAIASAVLMFEIAKADEHIDAQELTELSNSLVTSLGVSTEQVEALISDSRQQSKEATSLYPFTNLIKQEFSAEQRAELLSCLWKIAYADQQLDKYEEYFIRKIADLLYIPHSVYIKTKLDAENVSANT